MNNIDLTTIIIAANVIASFYAWSNPAIYANWMMNPYEISRKKEYYRFLTSGFIHADYVHLFFNMFTLYGFGRNIEQVFKAYHGPQMGAILYLVLFLGAVIVSDMPSYQQHKNNYNYNSLGASGGVSAVLFACILLDPWMSLYVYFIPVKAIIFAILYTWYSFYMKNKGYDNINHSAHMYGAAFGVAFMLFAIPGVLSSFIGQMANWQNELF